jgi:hypothetical protein
MKIARTERHRAHREPPQTDDGDQGREEQERAAAVAGLDLPQPRSNNFRRIF